MGGVLTMRLLAVILSILLGAGAARGDIYLGPDGAWQNTIQTSKLDTIWLSNGVYNVSGPLKLASTNSGLVIIGNYGTRNLYGVTSNGHDEVVLSGGGTCQVVSILSAATNIVFRGITITDGHTEPSVVGAGVGAVSGTSPLFDRCNIVSNTANYSVAGAQYINLTNSTVGYNVSSNQVGGLHTCTFWNSMIISNRAIGAGHDYGGIYACAGYNSIIQGNYAEDDYGAGGGANNLESCLIVSNASGDDFVLEGITRNCVIEYNTADVCAGSYQGSHTNTVFRYNSARTKAGASFSANTWGCTYQSNTASTSLGAASGGTHYRTLFQGNRVTNSAATGGGAGGTDSTVFNAYNCVFDGNYVTRAGYPQALLIFNDIRNCTIVNHTTNGPVASGWKTTSMVYNCIFYLNTSNSITTATNLANNTTNDPLFLEGETNYLLSAESPAIDAGDDGFAPAGNDYYNRTRITGLAVDIGAVEFQTGDEPAPAAISEKKKLMMLMMED